MSASYSGARSAGPAMEAFQPPEDGTFLRRSPLPAYEATLPFLQSSPLAVVVTDAQGRIIFPNPSILRLLGYAACDLVGRQFQTLVRGARGAESNAGVVTSAPLPAGLLPASGKELLLRRKSGRWLPVEVALAPMQSPRGLMVATLVHEITHQQRPASARGSRHTERKSSPQPPVGKTRRSHKPAQSLSHRLLEAQEAERRNIGRELHDEVGQLLTATKLLLDSARDLPPEVFRSRAAEASLRVSELLDKVRAMSLDLRPAMLDDLGLLPALLCHIDRFSSQTGVRVSLKHSGLKGRRFDADLETAIYRITQEALTNVARHAGVPEAAVRVAADKATLYVTVADQGAGFDAGSWQQSHSTAGLASMRERTALLDGTMTVVSAPGRGTTIEIALPLPGSTEGSRWP